MADEKKCSKCGRQMRYISLPEDMRGPNDTGVRLIHRLKADKEACQAKQAEREAQLTKSLMRNRVGWDPVGKRFVEIDYYTGKPLLDRPVEPPEPPKRRA